jgi:hypothetical protein
MSLLSACGACGVTPKFRDIAIGVSDGQLEIKCTPPWRVRNAGMNDLGVPGANVVLLCSDVCEERYGRDVGFLEGK